MEILTTVLIAVVPALLVLLMAYMMINSFLENHQDFWKSQLELKRADLQFKSLNETLPVRFQAYERLILFLERNSPIKLVSQFPGDNLSAQEYQMGLVNNIRTEMSHNITQQLYVSDETWMVVQTSIEELISIINTLGKGMPQEANGHDLRMTILNYFMDSKVLIPNARAINHLKLEVRTLLG